ncbi:hypothetical protein [Methylorubrum populi]
MQAGSSANLIPDQAELQLNLRTYDDRVRDKVLSSIKRVVEGEAPISGAPKPPLLIQLGRFPLTVYDADATAEVAGALKQRLGAEQVQPAGNGTPARTSASWLGPGTCPRCSGSWAGPARRFTPRRRRMGP